MDSGLGVAADAGGVVVLGGCELVFPEFDDELEPPPVWFPPPCWEGAWLGLGVADGAEDVSVLGSEVSG